MLTIQRRRGYGRHIAAVIVLLVISSGLYAGVTTISPASGMFFLTGREAGSTLKKLQAAAGTNGDRLYLPKINVDVAIGDTSRDAIRQAASVASPAAAGNFVLTAQRFSVGATPQATAEGSPFYHIDELAVGDQLVLDYQHERYNYVVSALSDTVTTSEMSKLILYAVDSNGRTAGKIIEATPVTNVVYRKNT